MSKQQQPLRAVAMFGKVVPPRHKTCPTCYHTLDCWKTSRGLQYACPNCRRVFEE